MIDYDRYKYEMCTITEDDCCGGSCRDCETAISENHTNKIEEKAKDLERYTKFERKSNFAGIEVMSDVHNVIAKIDLETLKYLQDNTEVFKKTIISYCPGNLRQYAEDLRKLRKYNNLGIPDMIWGTKNYPAAFLFGDVVYLIAPKIERE